MGFESFKISIRKFFVAAALIVLVMSLVPGAGLLLAGAAHRSTRRLSGAMPELRAHRLSKHFSGMRVVKDVNVTIRPGEIVGYLGPNGSGKTTTARMLAGLLEPSSGVVEYGGRDIRDDLVAFRRDLGYIPEEPYLYPFLSGREYLQLVGRLREMPERCSATKIDGFLRLFGLTSRPIRRSPRTRRACGRRS